MMPNKDVGFPSNSLRSWLLIMGNYRGVSFDENVRHLNRIEKLMATSRLIFSGKRYIKLPSTLSPFFQSILLLLLLNFT